VPSGYRVFVFAKGLEHPTALAVASGRAVYAAEEGGAIVRVRPRSDGPSAIASGFPTPLGLLWHGRTLYVSAQGRLEALTVVHGRVVGRRTIVADLPFGLHQQDSVVLARDGRLYLGSGSTCNACAEADARSAAILSLRPDGGDLRVVAHGLRNPFGLALDPRTGDLYASVNGRDDLGDAEPAEEIVAVEQGRDFGWPKCWPSYATRRLDGDCAGVTPPVAYLEPHSSADGMAFWRGRLFVALWGQYYSSEHGRYVVRVDVRSGRVQRFATGFDHPLAVATDPWGGLLVADYGSGVVYRIAAGKG